MINEKFVVLGALINLTGTLGYVKNTLNGSTRPNRASWIMWTIAPMVAFAAQISEGVGLRSLVTFMAGFGPLLILVASFVNRKSVWRLTKFDIICGVLSFLGLCLWAITKQGNLAILLAIVADLFAAIPTLKKSYHDPESESSFAYITAAVSGGITLLTIKNWTFATWGFPLYIVLICLALSFLIVYKPSVKAK